MVHALSPDGTRLAYGTRVDSLLYLNILELSSGQKRRIEVGEDAPPPGEIQAMGFGGWLALNSSVRRPDLFAKAVALNPVSELEHFIRERKTHWDEYSDSFSIRYLDAMFGDLKERQKPNCILLSNTFRKESELPRSIDSRFRQRNHSLSPQRASV